jgi:hypothetical protein
MITVGFRVARLKLAMRAAAKAAAKAKEAQIVHSYAQREYEDVVTAPAGKTTSEIVAHELDVRDKLQALRKAEAAVNSTNLKWTVAQAKAERIQTVKSFGWVWFLGWLENLLMSVLLMIFVPEFQLAAFKQAQEIREKIQHANKDE